jgi:THO complex subunit 2
MILIHKDEYFKHVNESEINLIISYIMQHCVLDRVLLSPLDAIYCTYFGIIFHTLEVYRFSTVSYLNKSVLCIAPLVFCSTEAEAGFIGYSLNEVLKVCYMYIHVQMYMCICRHKYMYIYVYKFTYLNTYI